MLLHMTEIQQISICMITTDEEDFLRVSGNVHEALAFSFKRMRTACRVVNVSFPSIYSGFIGSGLAPILML